MALILVAAPGIGAQTTWREAPDYLALFAPVAHRDAYRITISQLDVEHVLSALAEDPSLIRAPGSWEAQSLGATDAFGTAGRYDHWALARLYGMRRPKVARGVRMDRGRIVEAWTLISPYPSTDLRHLEPGTLRIVLQIAQ